ncbi:hypothetical protein R83H12_01217 [Fibrobacteria bacterium R8-3-H12]
MTEFKKSDLDMDRGSVVGIGRVKFPRTLLFNHEIPWLPFIVLQREDDSFVSTCIYFRIDGYGDTEEAAQYDMVENVWHFLESNFRSKLSEGRRWLGMHELSKVDEISTVLWDKYHAVQFMLAEKGIATENIEAEIKINKEMRREHGRIIVFNEYFRADSVPSQICVDITETLKERMRNEILHSKLRAKSAKIEHLLENRRASRLSSGKRAKERLQVARE